MAAGPMFPPPAAPHPGGPASVGFEWQVSTLPVVDATTGDVLPPKTQIGSDDPAGVDVESDSRDVELITRPVDQNGQIIGAPAGPVQHPLQTLEQQMNAMYNLLNELANVPSDGYITAPDGTQVAVPHGFGVVGPPSIGQIPGTPQATVGFPLSRLTDLLGSHWVGAGAVVAYIQGAYPAASPDLQGLLALVELYRREVAGSRPTDTDGPKQNVTVMARTDFHTLYNMLSPADQAAFAAIAGALGPAQRDAPLMPSGYNMEDSHIPAAWGPTFGEWLDSISNPAAASAAWTARVHALIQGDPTMSAGDKAPWTPAALTRQNGGKDLMSPPPFFREHGAAGAGFTYAMGREGAGAGNLALVEIRNFRRNAGGAPMSKLSFDQFRNQVDEFGRFVFGDPPPPAVPVRTLRRAKAGSSSNTATTRLHVTLKSKPKAKRQRRGTAR